MLINVPPLQRVLGPYVENIQACDPLLCLRVDRRIHLAKPLPEDALHRPYKAKCANRCVIGADGKGGKMGTRDFASPEVKAESDAQLTEISPRAKLPRCPPTVKS